MSPARLYPAGIRVEPVLPLLQQVIDASAGLTRDEIDRAYLAVEAERRATRGDDDWPCGRLTEIEEF